MRSWNFKVTGNEDQVIDRARNAAASKGLTLTGDALAGKVAGSGLEGRYVLSGATLTVEVDKKPFFASWEDVQAEMRALFEG